MPAVLHHSAHIAGAGVGVQPAALRMFRNAGGSEDNREAININGAPPSWAEAPLEPPGASHSGGAGAGREASMHSGGGSSDCGRHAGATKTGRQLVAPGEQRCAVPCMTGKQAVSAIHTGLLGHYGMHSHADLAGHTVVRRCSDWRGYGPGSTRSSSARSSRSRACCGSGRRWSRHYPGAGRCTLQSGSCRCGPDKPAVC